MTTLTKFPKSRQAWSKCEDIFAEYLSTYPGLISLERAPKKGFPDWDIKITYEKDGKIKEASYEIKSDRKSEYSGNFCLEYYNIKKGWPSGICTSKADYYVYFAWGKRWIARRDELLVKLISECHWDIRDWGNDNSRMLIKPMTEIENYFSEVPNLDKKPFEED